MAVLVAAVILVGAIGLLNLLLTFGVIRRLREHNRLLSEGAAATAGGIPVAGDTAAPFTAVTIEGAVVSADLVTDATLLAVLSTTCAPCREKLPEFAALAAAHPGGRAQVLAVIVGDDEGAAPFIEGLRGVAQVVREREHDGVVASAFGVQAFPVFALLDAGAVVRASSHDPRRVPVSTAA